MFSFLRRKKRLKTEEKKYIRTYYDYVQENDLLERVDTDGETKIEYSTSPFAIPHYLLYYKENDNIIIEFYYLADTEYGVCPEKLYQAHSDSGIEVYRGKSFNRIRKLVVKNQELLKQDNIFFKFFGGSDEGITNFSVYKIPDRVLNRYKNLILENYENNNI